MAIINETLSSVNGLSSHRQAILPSYLLGSFLADDIDDHIYKPSGMGKGRLTLAVNNPANQALTVTFYGMHSATGAIGDEGTFPIGSAFTVALASKDYETCYDPFPWYLVKIIYAVVPTDNPLKTCTVYITFSAY